MPNIEEVLDRYITEYRSLFRRSDAAMRRAASESRWDDVIARFYDVTKTREVLDVLLKIRREAIPIE